MGTEWRTKLRTILRNSAARTVKEWCHAAGISGRCTKLLVAYSEGVSVTELSDLCGYTLRAVSRYRLQGLKQLRSYMVQHPDVCPVFVRFLSGLNHEDGGPMPR